MSNTTKFLFRTRGTHRLHIADILMYLYLGLGTLLMFGPVLWGAVSSFKTAAELERFPPSFLPSADEKVEVEGYDSPLSLYTVTLDDGTVAELAQVRRIGIEAQFIDPVNPGELIKVHVNQTEPVRSFALQWQNYIQPLQRFQFFTFFKNSVIVTVSATLITLFINSLAAFALSKYDFRGRHIMFILILGTLMIPTTVTLVPNFLVVTTLGWSNKLIGVILPTVATPTGVFLLRQYMLTIPDDLLDAARIDGASEWRIYWQIILPLASPAIAVLAIFSVMWRWNDFLWPLVVLTQTDKFTLQMGLNMFQGQFDIQWQYLLAMSVLALLPITIIFIFLQRYITTGIASSGVKM
ncbi:MAG: carbohydrate ABC transporter permease [Anaerolineae bacterium]|nr:carbohydrate ABC transporter permease [Anaerolineae bacterium]